MLCLVQKNLLPHQKLNNLLDLTKNLNPVIFSPLYQKHQLKTPVFPMVNLWSIWNNIIIYTCFGDFVYLKNLYTNHKKVFYLYDLNWHEKSLNYKFTLDAIESADVLICRSQSHANKIEEYSGRRPLIISEINFKEVLNDTSRSTE